MNFISDLESTQVRIELKYCERCGGLFFRAPGTTIVYCCSCRVRRTECETHAFFSKRAARRERKPRIPVRRGAPAVGTGVIGNLQGIAATGVRPC